MSRTEDIRRAVSGTRAPRRTASRRFGSHDPRPWVWLVLTVALCWAPPARPARAAAGASPLIAVAALHEAIGMAEAELRIVDLRDEAAYAEAHIREALRMGPRELRFRGFFRLHHVVLVYGSAELCAALRLREVLIARGFSTVQVLAGGFEAWRDAGLPLERGRPARAAGPALARRLPTGEEIDVVTLKAVRRCTELRPLLVRLEGAAGIGGREELVVDGAPSPDRVAKVVSEALLGTPAAERWRRPIVLVDARGDGTARGLATALRGHEGMEGCSLFALHNGAEAWTRLERARSGLPEGCPGCGGPPASQR